MKCYHCGFENVDTAMYCEQCGTQLRQPEGGQQNGYQPAGPYQQAWPPVVDYQYESGKSASTVSMVCGILSIVIPCIGIILGIVAIMYSNKAKKLGVRNGQATAGLVTGIIGLSGWALYLLLLIFSLTMVASFS